MKTNQNQSEKKISDSNLYFSFLRIFYFIFIVATFFAGSVILVIRNRVLLDEAVILCILNVIFLIVFIISITQKRLIGKEIFNSTSYGRLLFIIIISWALEILFSTLHNFYAPVMVLALLLNSLLPSSLAMGLCMYFNILLSLIGGMGSYSFYCYATLIVIGIWLSDYLKEANKSIRIFISFIVLIVSFFIPILFIYFSVYSIDRFAILEAGVTAIVSFLFSLFFKLLYNYFQSEKSNIYEIILDDNYSMISDMKKLLPLEYEHAKRVSVIARKCAEVIDADMLVTQTAGVYYHVLNIQSKSDINTLLKKMNDKCFPKAVISIISEKEEFDKKPLSKESAIVHMTDKVFTKLEAMKSQDINSDWNLNMLIYQTLNELSGTGIYDDSGVSMNEFLKIRDCLVMEAQKLENMDR